MSQAQGSEDQADNENVEIEVETFVKTEAILINDGMRKSLWWMKL